MMTPAAWFYWPQGGGNDATLANQETILQRLAELLDGQDAATLQRSDIQDSIDELSATVEADAQPQLQAE